MFRKIIELLILVSMTKSEVLITVQGMLRGVEHDGYTSYRGIPYATVLPNNGRFKSAGLAPNWNGIRDPHESHCSPTASEDCLQLDIHVPNSGSTPWSVLVWVTGGSGRYDPGQLVRRDIIVVVVHHRQGPLGFLCLSEETVPGNAGIKDVILALRWIRDNIVAFKGNPARVVVAGQSFGAAMVEALTLSPMAHGLYHGVILQSGSVLAPWCFNYDSKERAIALAKMLDDIDDVSMTLLNANVGDLVDKSNKLDMPYFPFGICEDKSLRNEERVLFEAPIDLLNSRKVKETPLMMGYNTDEAYVFALALNDSKIMATLSKDVSVLLPEELKFLNNREMQQVTRQIEDMYFKNNKSMTEVLAYHRDAFFITHIYRSARLHASSSNHPVYFYQFSHLGDVGVVPERGVTKTGAAHSDELAYLFEGKDLEGNDRMVQEHLARLWINFVKYLNPTHKESVQWDALDPTRTRVFDIGTELKMLDFPHAKTSRMWEDIYDKYYYSRNRK